MSLGQKTRLFLNYAEEKHQKTVFSPKTHASRAWYGSPRMQAQKQCFSALFRTTMVCSNTPGLRNVVLDCVFAIFLVFFSVFFLVLDSEHISPLCNIFKGLLNLHPLSFQILMRCFVLRFFAWFCSELHQKHLIIDWFGKTKITWLKMKILQNVLQTIENCSKTPLIWIKT